MEYAHGNLSRFYVIRRELVLTERVKRVVSGNVVQRCDVAVFSEK